MPLLKFRVIYEDDDSVYRDIEIKPAQSFEEFEAVIKSSYNMPVVGTGVFYLSNDNWQRGRQIYPGIKKEEKKSGSRAKAQTLPSIVAFIDDPHQHFLFEFKGSQEFSFLIELLTIGGTESAIAAYPVMVRSQGASPFRKDDIIRPSAKKKIVAMEETEVETEEEDDEADEPSPFVENSNEADEEELASIEGEEGEPEGDIMEGDAIKDDVDDGNAEDIFSDEDDLGGEDENVNLSEDEDEDL